jgi:hypothetical protein
LTRAAQLEVLDEAFAKSVYGDGRNIHDTIAALIERDNLGLQLLLMHVMNA